MEEINVNTTGRDSEQDYRLVHWKETKSDHHWQANSFVTWQILLWTDMDDTQFLQCM